MDAIDGIGWKLDLVYPGQRIEISVGDVFAARAQFFDRCKLVHTDRRRDVGEVVLESRRHDLVVRAASDGEAIPGRLASVAS